MNRARKSNYIQFNDCRSEHPESFGTNIFNYKQITKLFFILLLTFIFWGCDEVEEGLIDPNEEIFLVDSLAAPTILKYFGSETELTTSISFSDSKSVLKTWVNIDSQDGTVDVVYRKEMVKSAENEYSISIPMEADMPSLTYTIDYYFQTGIQAEKKIASHNFEYDNNQINIAPVISNPLFYYLNEPPELLEIIKNGDQNEFIVSIEVADENGLRDIDSVYIDLFNYQDPNNTIVTKILLYDDGSVDHGDDVAEDGIYSRKGFFPDDSEGNRRFVFIARDRRGLSSNIVTHNFVVVK